MKKRRIWLEEVSLTFPSFFWLLFFFLIPTLIVFAFAFRAKDYYGGIGSEWTLETIRSLADFNYLVLIGRTVWLSAIATIICLAMALPIGYQMARSSSSVRSILLLLIVMPFWSSFLVRIFAWKSLLHPEGFFKHLLVKMHLVSPEASLLYNATAVILVMVYTYLPFGILPIYAAASKFNFQLFEAAMDLGASRLKTFIKIFIPGIQKGIWTATLMIFIPAIGAYVIPDLVGGAHNEMIGNKIAQRTFVERNLPLASALSSLLAVGVLLPMTAITLMQAYSKKYGKDARGKE